LILANKYDDVHRLFLELINPNLSLIDLELLLPMIIRLCPIVENRDLFCENILLYFILKLVDLKVNKNFALIFFNLSLAILKLRVFDAPYISNCLLKKQDFYPWKELINGIIELVETCISYDTIIDKETFSKLDELENIINILSEKAQAYPIISKRIHSIALQAILRWSNTEFNGSRYVYRMGAAMFKLIDLQQINEDICIKFIDTLQNITDFDNQELYSQNRFFFHVSIRILYFITLKALFSIYHHISAILLNILKDFHLLFIQN
jgi:hypothetical protein